jgi:hypothetical protein
MRTVCIRARLTTAYGALDRVLRHCERMGFELQHLVVKRIDDEAMELSARLGNVPASTIASLAARFEYHFGVMDVAISEHRVSMREAELELA